MIPVWLHVLSVAALLFGIGCAAFLAVDVARHPQPMWIMNVVWPVTALFGSGAIVWAYLRYGRPPAMPLAMMAGFVTSYPVNWWLVSSGVKEKM